MSSTNPFSDAELTALYLRLNRIKEDFYDNFRKRTDIETELANKGTQSAATGSTFADIFSGDIEELNAELSAAEAPFNLADIAAGANQYSSITSSLFGRFSLVSNVAAGDVSKDGITTSFQDQTQDNQFRSPYAECDNIVQSTAALVQDVVTLQKDKIAKAGAALRSTLSLLTTSDPGVAGAAAVLGAGALDRFLGVQDVLLKQIADEVTNINEDIEKLNADDYGTDHHLVIGQSLERLLRADNIFRAQLNNINSGFRLNRTGYETAQADIVQVKEWLCGVDILDILDSIPSIRVAKITARVLLVEQLLILLKKSDENRQRVQFNLGFNSALEDLSHLDHLYAPVLALLRCRLQVTMEDMAVTIKKNNIATYLLKEKLWCFELSILNKMIDASRAFDVELLKKGTFSDQWNDLTGAAVDQNYLVSIDSIIGAGEAFLSNVKYKLTYNADPRMVVARGQLVQKLIAQRLDENSEWSISLGGKTVTLKSEIVSGLALVNQFIRTQEETASATSILNQLKDGNIKDFFTTETVEEQGSTIVSDIGEALEDLGCTIADAGVGVLTMIDILEDETRAATLHDESLTNYNETYLRQVLTSDQPRLNVDL